MMTPGDILKDRYKIYNLLGRGSMGVTYKALDLKAKRPVAVKQLHLSRAEEWKSVEMFEREAKILQQLTHPRVPAYVDYFSHSTDSGTQFFLIQEYITGKTLKQLIEEGWRASEPEILDIFIDLVDILDALHTVRPPVIHRDINPKNIIISPNHIVKPPLQEVYLVDFGAVQDKIRTTFLGGTTIVGTFGYVPFEQFSGQAVPASDYYALGATLLYMLTHRHPSEFPTDDLKPEFAPFLHSSPIMAQLLHGLLEPSVKKRIRSIEQIRDILDQNFVEPTEQFIPPAKPVKTSIEKIAEDQHHVVYRIPKQKIGLVLKRTILHLSPHWLWVSEEILGVGSSGTRRIPIKDIHPSDFTWYFQKGRRAKGKSVFGLNYQGETVEIGVNVTKQEIEWLTDEINEYIWTLKTQLPPSEQTHEMYREIEESSRENPESSPKPKGTNIKASSKGRHHKEMKFQIPNVISKSEIIDISATISICLAFIVVLTGAAVFFIMRSAGGWILGGALLFVSAVFWIFGLALLGMGVSKILGKTTLHLTPEWIHVSRKCCGIGRTRHIPTDDLHPGDIIRYFSKHALVLGINYDDETLNIGNGLTSEEIEWLRREIRDYIAKHAKPIPKDPPDEIVLDMK